MLLRRSLIVEMHGAASEVPRENSVQTAVVGGRMSFKPGSSSFVV